MACVWLGNKIDGTGVDREWWSVEPWRIEVGDESGRCAQFNRATRAFHHAAVLPGRLAASLHRRRAASSRPTSPHAGIAADLASRGPCAWPDSSAGPCARSLSMGLRSGATIRSRRGASVDSGLSGPAALALPCPAVPKDARAATCDVPIARQNGSIVWFSDPDDTAARVSLGDTNGEEIAQVGGLDWGLCWARLGEDRGAEASDARLRGWRGMAE